MLQLVSNSQAKLFDKKFVALTLRDVRKCEKCKRGYDIKYRFNADNKPNSSRPVLLNCGHNICENCIYQNRNNLCCPVCNIRIEFEHTRWLKKSYDLNFCLLGQLANTTSFLSSEPTGPAAVTGMLASESFVQKCSECEQAPAVGICLNCKVDFCKRCFTGVHQNSKVLKKHKLSEFEMQLLQLRMPKERFCKMHIRVGDKFCLTCQKIYCNLCIRHAHSTHVVNSLSVENARHNDKIISFLEIMKQTREKVRIAQKDVRNCDQNLKDYAAAITLEISDYFLDLHNFLQIEERRILEEFKLIARPSQNALLEACVKISDSQTALNNMRSTLEAFLEKPPHNVHIKDVIESATTQLEQMPCQIQISELKNNPFIFKKVKDVRKEIKNSYKVVANDPKIHIRLSPMYGDENNSLEISSDMILNSEANMESLNYNREPARPQTSVSSSSTIAIGKSKRDSRITCIINPKHFYIQDEDAIKDIRKRLSEIDEGAALHVSFIKINDMYIVFQSNTKQWYRCIVREELKPSKTSKDPENIKYKVFLLDYGTYAEFSKKMLRIIPEQLGAIPAATINCGLVDIAPPIDDSWPTEARELMEEIIQNKPVQVNIQDTTNSPWGVEVVTTNFGEPISLRDALLYAGLAIDTSVSSSQKIQKFSGLKPTQLSKMKQSLLRPMHISGEIFRVDVTHIENPQRFFAIKFAHLEELKNLELEMEAEYSDKKESYIIYYAQLHMCCALFVERKWYRGCIEEINAPNDIRVRLVDDGRSVTASWRQLRVLKDKFLSQREMSIECSIAEIQPLQENNYEWTNNAIAEFVRMTSNPHIQMTIASSNQFRYQVILNVVKKHLDINIGAMLVKFKHALSTGDASANVEHNRESATESFFLPDEQLNKINPPASSSSAIRSLKRTPIEVIHVNSPGEFYIYLVEHIAGILKFQEQLQLAQESRLENETVFEDVNWKENDHCLVLTSVKENASDQWFRGVIKEIDDNNFDQSYSVFLRDKGVIVRNVNNCQLMKIEDNYDRVTNGAILCHLACVHPTGGMKKWSHSSIDEFQHNINHFESIGATIQGQTKNGSIPVVLWGIFTETNDALGPCTPKYTNINKMLVSAGLAHLIEKIDITRQLDQFVQQEIQQGEQTLQEWYDNFIKTLENLSICENDNNDPVLEKTNISNYELSDLVANIESGNIIAEWLPAEAIEKTVFTAYPTYVDYDAIVYMHDSEKHGLLNGMRKKINDQFDLGPATAIDEKWAPGQPCLARYHLDRFLYRATVQKLLSNNKFEVRFVDYGNVEVCEIIDLYRMTAFPNIPIQAVPFIIDGIRPKAGQEVFNTTTLDLIHGSIVDKLCGIRIPNGEHNKKIKKCSIRFENNDLASYLIQNGYARRPGNRTEMKVEKKLSNKLRPVEVPKNHDDSINSEDELREFMKHKICDLSNDDDDNNKPKIDKKPKTDKSEKPKGMFKLDEYNRMYERMQNEKLYQSIVVDDDDDDSKLLEDRELEESDEDDVLELEFSFKSNYWHGNDNLDGAPPPTQFSQTTQSASSSNFDEFDPCDTSSMLSNFSGIDIFKAPQLPLSLKSFYCEVAYIRSPTVVHIFPHLSELKYRQLELARRIKSMVQKLPMLSVYEAKTPCLARFSNDKIWYRAIIRSHNAPLHLVKVFYVDYLNTELVKEEYIRKCPNDLLAWPLRTFEMKLNGIKPNPRLREKDVKQALKKCLTGRKLLAKIVEERGNIPEICLYKSKNETDVLAYEDLIVQKYFCKT